MIMDSFYPPMLGSFLGVSLGILANHYYQDYIADKNRIRYKKMIKSEIELCINILEEKNVKLLPMDQWGSIVNSGALKLFDAETELVPLSINYQEIRNYDHLITDKDVVGYSWEEIEMILNEGCECDKGYKFLRVKMDRIVLLMELEKLNNAKWLNPSNEPAPGYNDTLYEESRRDKR